jgi:hypothetical protein
MSSCILELAIYKATFFKIRWNSLGCSVVCYVSGSTFMVFVIYTFAGITSVRPYSVESDCIRSHIRWNRIIFVAVFGGVGPYSKSEILWAEIGNTEIRRRTGRNRESGNPYKDGPKYGNP